MRNVAVIVWRSSLLPPAGPPARNVERPPSPPAFGFGRARGREGKSGPDAEKHFNCIAVLAPPKTPYDKGKWCPNPGGCKGPPDDFEPIGMNPNGPKAVRRQPRPPPPKAPPSVKEQQAAYEQAEDESQQELQRQAYEQEERVFKRIHEDASPSASRAAR